MKKILDFITYQRVSILLLVFVFFNTCGNPTKMLNKKIEQQSAKIDSLKIELSQRPTVEEYKLITRKQFVYMLDSKKRSLEELALSNTLHREIDSLEKN
jgi:hypothetical protein